MKTSVRTCLTAFAVLLIAGAAWAQDNGGDRGGRGGRGGFDPAQMRQRMMDRYKTDLGATDEEWKALQPRLEKVMTTSMTMRMGGFGFGGRGGRGGGPGGPGGGDANANTPQNPIAQAASDLRKAIDDKSTSADDIAKKLAALREARKTAKDEYDAAAKDLREILTQRQEAVLVMAGLLE